MALRFSPSLSYCTFTVCVFTLFQDFQYATSTLLQSLYQIFISLQKTFVVVVRRGMNDDFYIHPCGGGNIAAHLHKWCTCWAVLLHTREWTVCYLDNVWFFTQPNRFVGLKLFSLAVCLSITTLCWRIVGKLCVRLIRSEGRAYNPSETPKNTL